jgi:hypothetical protein
MKHTFIASLLIIGVSCGDGPIETQYEKEVTGETETAQKDPAEVIGKKMEAQEIAWNAGNLNEFMIGYWESDSLKFIGRSGLTYGWSASLANYEKAYPDRDAMGELHFDNLSVDIFCDDAAHVIGKWTLFRAALGDTIGGFYSLIWQKKNNDWVIVADHSS